MMASPLLSLWSCRRVRVYLLYSALLLDLALSQLLQQDQLGLLETQLLLQLLDDALPLLRAALLHTTWTTYTSEADTIITVAHHTCNPSPRSIKKQLLPLPLFKTNYVKAE